MQSRKIEQWIKFLQNVNDSAKKSLMMLWIQGWFLYLINKTEFFFGGRTLKINSFSVTDSLTISPSSHDRSLVSQVTILK